MSHPLQFSSPAADAAPASLRDFHLLWTSQLLSSMGTQASQLAFPLLVLALGGSPAMAGLAAALRSLPMMLFSLPIGALVDRWDRKRLMWCCDVLRALAMSTVALAQLGHVLTLAHVAIVAFLEGTLHTFFSLAQASSLPHLVPAAQMPRALALNEASESFSGMAGPSLGGLLFGWHAALPFGLDALSFGCSALGVGLIRRPFQTQRSGPVGDLWAEVRDGARWLWNHSLLRFLAMHTGGMNLASFGFPLILILLAQQMEVSSAGIGLLMACGGAGGLIGAALVAPVQRRLPPGVILIGASWAWALTWLLLAIAPNPLALGIAQALGFLPMPLYMATQFGLRLALIPDELRGRVNSVFRLVMLGVQPVSLALTGILLQAIGPVPTVLVLFVPQAVLCGVATLHPELRRTIG